MYSFSQIVVIFQDRVHVFEAIILKRAKWAKSIKKVLVETYMPKLIVKLTFN